MIISGSHNDELHLKPYTDGSKHKTSIKSFKLPFDTEDEGVNGDIGILIVNNMLLTGFDAPVEQVMYLDKIIVAHGLLQAIARVNRVGGAAKIRVCCGLRGRRPPSEEGARQLRRAGTERSAGGAQFSRRGAA